MKFGKEKEIKQSEFDESYDRYADKNQSNSKLIYALIALTVVTVILVVGLVVIIGLSSGGNTETTTPPVTATAPAATETQTVQPSATPSQADGTTVIISGMVEVPQIPVGAAPSFNIGTGDKTGCVIVNNSVSHEGDLILVNSLYTLDNDFSAGKLVNIYNATRLDSDFNNYPVSVWTTTLQMEKRALVALTYLLQGANAAGHTKYFVSEGYRTAAEQQAAYEEGEDGEVQLPGASEHQTGLAVDLGFSRLEGQSGAFGTLPQGQWMMDNAYLYGFIQRYTDSKASVTGIAGESWHYRYVGFPHSILMKMQDMCLEEYIDWIRSNKQITVNEADGAVRYEIYSQLIDTTSINGTTAIKISDRAMEAYNSGSAKITVSGDNRLGIIVTVIYN